MPNNRWVLTGASGQLGGEILLALSRDIAPADILALAGAGWVVGEDSWLTDKGMRIERIDLADHEAVRTRVTEFRPARILHVGGITAVSDAYDDPDRTEEVNVGGTRAVAEAAAACGARLVYTSTDMVFDGTRAPYRESDPPAPLSRYGASKAAAERVLADFGNALVVRLPLMYGSNIGQRPTTFTRQCDALHRGEVIQLFTDEYRTPIWLRDAAHALIALANSDETGLIHVAGPERVSRYEMMQKYAEAAGLEDPRLEGVSRLSIDAPEPRPADLSLDDTRFRASFPKVGRHAISGYASMMNR